MYDMIEVAEGVSAKTCEGCGQPGNMHGQGWMFVSCETCAAKRDK
jgi:hypothetical protein